MAVRILTPRFSIQHFSTAARTTRSAAFLTRFNPAFPAKQFSKSAMLKSQARGEETEGISEWKKRPPYLVHDKNEDFPVKYDASCHCGKVKYQLSREEPLDSKLCHCTTCQTQHGML